MYVWLITLKMCLVQHYILLKRSLESAVRISLYYQLQTTADSERIYRSSLNVQRIFPTLLSPISVKKTQLIPNGASLIVQKPFV